eukprot:1739618-Pleurochrysis_carterae.AAC.2
MRQHAKVLAREHADVRARARTGVEVVGRLVEEQNVGAHQHRAHERQLHAPAARQPTHLCAMWREKDC